MGVELDSQVDNIIFGMAIVASLWNLKNENINLVTILISLIYLISSSTRLSFYNLFSSGTGSFQGVPITLIAFLWSIVLSSSIFLNYIWILMLIFSLLMIIPVQIKRPPSKILLLLIGIQLIIIIYNLIT